MEDRLFQQACPMTASVNWEPGKDTQEEGIEWFEKFSTLPFVVREGLLSNKIVDAILDLAKNNGIESPEKVGEISRIVREAFFKIFDENQTKKRVQEKLGIAPDKTEKFIADLKEIISLVKKTGEDMIAQTTEKLPIIPALKKYEKLGDQEVTENWIEIEISGEREKVEPSVKNWLEDYIQNKGAQTHDNLERSDYAYKSQNTENLSTAEREKLSMILRSYDNDEPLFVDKESQEIYFDAEGSLESSKEKSGDEGKSVQVEEKKGVTDTITLAPFDLKSKQIAKEKQVVQEESQKQKEEVSRKPHEFSWPGNAGFNRLEDIDDKKDLSNKASNLQTKNPAQGTGHIVDLKNRN